MSPLYFGSNAVKYLVFYLVMHVAPVAIRFTNEKKNRTFFRVAAAKKHFSIILTSKRNFFLKEKKYNMKKMIFHFYFSSSVM